MAAAAPGDPSPVWRGGGACVMNKAKRKGDEAERQAAALISDLLGFKVKRKLGAGRAEDTGDVYGVPGHVIQVAHWKDIVRAVRVKPEEAEQQRLHDGEATFAATFIRLFGGSWRVVLTPEQWATYVRETLR